MHLQASRHETDYLFLVSRVREGIPVADAVEMMHSWCIPVARFAKVIGVSERKWSRVRTKVSSGVLSPVESDRLVRVWRIFEHAKSVFAGDEDGKGAIRWFATPNPALSGETPLSLLDTDAGVRQVDDVLTRIEFGVYG